MGIIAILTGKAQREAQAQAQREAEELQAEAEYKAYWQGRNDERRHIANFYNQPVEWSHESAEKVIRTHLGKQQRPDVPMRRIK